MITSAAAVMVSVFSIFVTLSMLEMKMMGVALAAAILIDATLIRLVMLPALAGAARRARLVAGPPGRPHGEAVAPEPELVAGGLRPRREVRRRRHTPPYLLPALARSPG